MVLHERNATSADMSNDTAKALAAIPGTILLAGAGKMGGAMLTGWLNAGVALSRIAAPVAGGRLEGTITLEAGAGDYAILGTDLRRPERGLLLEQALVLLHGATLTTSRGHRLHPRSTRTAAT